MRYVAYFRVSTQRQSISGLGLDAQRRTVHDYVLKHEGIVLGEYTEAESGKVCTRPELAKAVQHCKDANATLIVAKVDRLARDATFLMNLLDEMNKTCNCGIVFCDLPMISNADPALGKMLISIMACLGEWEARRISERTREGLEARRKRGLALGAALFGSRLTDAHRRKGAMKAARMRQESAVEFYTPIIPKMRALRDAGYSNAEIAAHFNREGRLTRKGLPWTIATVSNTINRGMVTAKISA